MAYAFDCPDSPRPFDGRLGQLESLLYDHWHGIHPLNGKLPGRQHFDPVELAHRYPQLLQHLWLVDVERDPLRFRLQLVGSAVYMTSPFARSGRYIDEFIDPASRAETLNAAFTRLVETRQPEFRQGWPRVASSRHARQLARLSLPLAADGETVDTIVNLTTYAWATIDRPDFARAD
ncbi:hypothetical protein GCM10017083_37490 [Thalassobaculum fulvum]|uniref:PAS domain-containing protein n=1 Tax=Thalassobaculum fulvum TaxID=1633335 RepID=A0A918XUK9_9PROT|nr:hypothetical protein [Thalassobaculum fulvum]GHD56862.1 hypothetical protein GCM10017083_37490 [Thalassobaculum fulvum]